MIASQLAVYYLAKGLGISPLEVYKMPISMAKDFLAIHTESEKLKIEEIEKVKRGNKHG